MKILHIIPSIAPVRGGPSEAIIEIVTSLSSLNIEAEIVTTNDNGNEVLDVPLGSLTEYKKVPVRFFDRFSPPIHSVQEFSFSTQLTSWLWNNITNYDLLHVHAIFSYPSTIAMAIARLKKIPYICRPLGQLCQWSLQQGHQKKQAYLSLIEKANLNGSQALHFTAEREQEEASTLDLKCPSFILPHGITISPKISEAKRKLRQQLGIAENEPIILFLSRLHPKKGLDYLIPALGKLTHKSFTFILAGNGDANYETEIENILHQNNIYSRTHRVGFVQGEYKNLLLQGADIFALTSYSENFGIAVLEALAAGIPALVTPGVALASILKKERIGYVSELNIDAIASSLEYCLDDLSQLKQIGECARQFVYEQYSWQQIATQLIKTYKAILQQQPSLSFLT